MDRLLKMYEGLTGCRADGPQLLPLSGSARKYYRISGDGGTFIGCIGTSLAENRAFLAIDRCFRGSGLHAPEVYAVSDDGMAYLQEDLGDCQLFEYLRPGIDSGGFTQEQLDRLHDTMCLLPAVQFKVGEGLDWGVCQDDFDRLRRDSLDFGGDTFMYRDFQARNIMIKDSEPCFIDFQGGRRGPVQYDLASFLWNAGTHFGASLRAELEDTYLRSLSNFTEVDEDDFRRRYRLLTLVRLLQEFGAYGYRGLVERKQLFIDCIPTALKCISELVSVPFAEYPYLSSLLERLAGEWDGSTLIPGLKVAL